MPSVLGAAAVLAGTIRRGNVKRKIGGRWGKG